MISNIKASPIKNHFPEVVLELDVRDRVCSLVYLGSLAMLNLHLDDKAEALSLAARITAAAQSLPDPEPELPLVAAAQESK
jgi:hypothetical protein